MAIRCNPQYFLNGKLTLQLLLVLTMTMRFAVTERPATVKLRGEVGGNVTFRCPVDKPGALTFLYFQRGNIFVNGYHASKPLPHTWENTKVDDNKSMLMHSLKVSHSGSYQCHIGYHGGQIAENHTLFHLSVTANYSEPTLTPNCGGENHRFSCWVTCASHGGYPGTLVTWHIPESQMWREMNNTEMPDPHTMLVNSSSTVYLNCSNGELTSLSCSVGGVTSKMISVCIPKEPENFNPIVTTAAVFAVVIAIIVAVVLWFKCKKGQRGAAATDTGVVNERQEELTVLNELKEGRKDAS